MSTSSVGAGLCQAGLWCGGGVLCPVLGWLSQDQLTKITNTLCGAEDSNPVRLLRNTIQEYSVLNQSLKDTYMLIIIITKGVNVSGLLHQLSLSGPSGSAGQCLCTRSGPGWANQ